MKILMATNTYLPIVGGLEKSIESFSRQFRQWGHGVLIVVPELEGIDSSDKGIVRVPAAFEQHGRFDFSVPLPLPRSLSKTVNAFQPDIIHAHHPFLMGENALRLSASHAKPLVFTYHIMFGEYFHYLPFPTLASKRFLVELAVGFANLATRVIAPSESVRDILEKEGVTVPMEVVPTGVDQNTFTKGNGKKVRREIGIPPGDFVLGYVGRLAPEKNLEFLSRALSEFMKENEKVHFLVVGKGPSEEEIRKIFFEAGLEKRVHLVGIRQGKDLADAYHAMDLFVFASKSETQGMVICEAMAAGLPALAVDAPGVREVVENLENGRLIPEEDENQFLLALSWLMRQPAEEWERLRENARKTAGNFSRENCARRALEVYEHALGDYSLPAREKQSEWHRLMRRFRAEWKITANFGRATGRALQELVSHGLKGEDHDRENP